MQLPNPWQYHNFRDWGQALIEAIERDEQNPSNTTVSAAPVLLARITDDARATTSGILLFDPVTATVRISIGGAWYHLVPVATP